MNSKTVTILIPTYKRPEKLKRAIASVLSQTYSDLEVMVFDNASGDETSEIVASFMRSDPRVRYHRHPENIGMCANFNFAVSRVETPYFAFLSDDDYYLPNFVTDAMSGLEKYPPAMFSVLNSPVVNECSKDKVIDRVLDAWPREGLYYPAEALHLVTGGLHPVITGCVFRSELKPDVYFDGEVELISDVPVWFVLTAKYAFCLSKKPGVYFIRHPEAAGNMLPLLKLQLWSRVERVIRKNTSVPSWAMQVISKSVRDRMNKLQRIGFLKLLESIKLDDMKMFNNYYSMLKEGNISAYQMGAGTINTVIKWKLAGRCLQYVLDVASRLLKPFQERIWR